MQPRTKIRVVLAGVTVAGAAAAAALLGPAGSAVGQSSTPLQLQIQVNSPASLVARGAGVEVSVTTQCSGTAPGQTNVQVFLNQRVGSGIAFGGGSTIVDCTGASQTSTVLVQSSPGSKPFKKGVAVAQGIINGCTPDLSFCTDQQVAPTIQIGS